jgi:hypothetical protein
MNPHRRQYGPLPATRWLRRYAPLFAAFAVIMTVWAPISTAGGMAVPKTESTAAAHAHHQMSGAVAVQEGPAERQDVPDKPFQCAVGCPMHVPLGVEAPLLEKAPLRHALATVAVALPPSVTMGSEGPPPKR